MSNGGYKGASPARETSPEQYPGVWELTEQFQAQADGNWPFQETDCAPKSLRFHASDSAYLSRTPSAAGNKRVFTFSCWVKRTNIGGVYPRMFGTYDGSQYTGWDIEFNNNDQIDIHYYNGSSYVVRRTTNAYYRDPSAWYSIVVSVDLNIVGNDQVKLFVNGEQVTSFATTTNANIDTNIGDVENRIGYNYSYSDFFLAEVNFIDGQALSCDEFGFFDGQGLWMPKRFTGDYSSGPDWNNFISGTQYSTGRSLDMTFDGLDNTYSAAAAGETITFAPVPAITGLTKVKLRVYKDSGSTTDITLNGNVITSSFNLGQYTDAEFTVNNLTELKWTTNSSNMWIGVSQIFVERGGVYELLTPPAVGRNSFHLDFSDGVKDQSGLGNDWTGNNVAVSGDGPSSSPVWESGDSGWTIASGGGSASEGGSNGYLSLIHI